MVFGGSYCGPGCGTGVAATRTIPHFTVLPSEFFASPFCPFSLNSMVDPTTNWVGLTVLPSFERQMYSFEVVSITSGTQVEDQVWR